MGPMTTRVIFVVLVSCTLGVWNSRTDRDAVVLQQRTLHAANGARDRGRRGSCFTLGCADASFASGVQSPR